MPTDATNLSARAVYLVQDATDDALVARCLAGDASAFEPLVDRYQRPFFAIAVRLLGDYDDAKDAVQNAFVKAYSNLSGYQPGRRFFSWAYRILVNECLNARRARRPSEPLAGDLAADGTPFDRLAAAERRRRVQQAISALPREQREVIVLRHFTDLSYEAISDAIGIPVKTVKSRLYSARQRLVAVLFAWSPRT